MIACCVVLTGFSIPATAQDEHSARQRTAGDNQSSVIQPEELPATYPHAPYRVFLYTRGGNLVPSEHWSVEGTLPLGIRLEDGGELHGEAERAGEFNFAVVVKDGSQPQQKVRKEYVLKVTEALTVKWKVPAHVNSNRIEGSVEVTNTTPEDMDLTFDVKAVADNGRATEIGYQHFPLQKGTVGMLLPFGDTLPHGGYVVYVNVVGEVAKRNVIYKQELKTDAALQVAVGP